MDIQPVLIVIAGVALFLKELITKSCWSAVLYLNRGEYNVDGDEETIDEFYLFNPNVGSWLHCYIFGYSLMGVDWGFIVEDGFIKKTSNWLDWADFRGRRFPVPEPITQELLQSLP